jgi:hypothetical protein
MGGVRKVSEGVRVDKLRRDSSFLNVVGTDPGEVRTGKKLWSRKISKEENRWSGFAEENSRNPADRQIWEKLREFNP